MKKSLLILIMLCSMTFAGQAMAGMVVTPGDLTLELGPSATINVGDTAYIWVGVNGLGNLTAPSLSSAHIDVTYDPAILSFVGNPTFYGSLFGTASNPASLTWSEPVQGTVRLALDSFLSPSELDAKQGSYVGLAILGFEGVAGGSTTFGAENVTLLDGFGNGFPNPPTILNSTFTVNPVPLPASVFLFGAGLVGLLGLRKKKIS